MRVAAMIAVLALPSAACSTYAQHRAALVPHAAPIDTDGQPIGAAAQVTLGASNVADIVKPGAGAPNAGDAVPGTQLHGGLALRPTKNFAFTFIYERGLDATAHALNASEPAIHNGDVDGKGLGFTYSFETPTPGLRVGIASEVVVWETPWIQYTTCVSNCGSMLGTTTVDSGSDTVPTLAFAIVPSYRTGRWTLFGGATVRQHPTLSEKVTTDIPLDPDVETGPWNIIANVGASIELGGGIRAKAILHQDLTWNPVKYGPGLGLMVAIPLGRDPVKPRVTVPAPPPTP